MSIWNKLNSVIKIAQGIKNKKTLPQYNTGYSNVLVVKCCSSSVPDFHGALSVSVLMVAN